MSTVPTSAVEDLDRLQWRALAVGVVTLAVCAVGAFFSPAQFFRAYLAAYQLYLGIALGCFAILMIYHTTGGAWGFLIRRFLEAGMRTLPLLAVLFIPIALGVKDLYLWARPSVVEQVPKLQYNHLYLNVPFWCVRQVIYFATWIAVAWALSAWSRQQDRAAEFTYPRKFWLLSGPGLAWYGVTITFGSVDWIMSIQAPFRSTIFGPLVATGQLVTAMAVAVILLAWLVDRPPWREVISPDVLNDLGNLLFTFLVLWGYMNYFQYMFIWMGNLRSEVVWYLPRSEGGWKVVAAAVVALHFAVPFFLLLMRDIKRRARALAAVAGLILFMHLPYLYWQILPPFAGPGWQQVLPDFPAGSVAVHWMDFLTPLGIGGLWLAYFLWQVKQYPLLPRHDPSAIEAVRLRHVDEEEAARREAIQHG